VKFIGLFEQTLHKYYWSNISDEVDQLSEMEESNIIGYWENKDELVVRDCLSFTINEAS